MERNIKVYGMWGPRGESREDCGRRLHRMINGLEEVDSSLTGWKINPTGTPGGYEPIGSELDDHIDLMEDLHTTEEWGYTAYGTIRKNSKDSIANFDVSCGANKFPTDINRVKLEFGKLEEAKTRGYVELEFAKDVLGVVVRSWDCVTVEFDVGMADTLDDVRLKNSPWLGWITYLQADLNSAPELPPGVSAQRFLDGVLIQCGNTPPDPDRDEDVERHREVFRRLKEAGLVEPIVST